MLLKKLIILSLLLFSGILQAKEIHIALIKDGPAQKDFLSEQRVKREIIDLLGSEFSVVFVDSTKTTADWTIVGVNKVIDRLFADPNVDIIVTLGAVSSNEIAKQRTFPKPTIAAVTIDPAAQSFPISKNRSSKHNFTYIADVKEPGHEVVFFRDFVGVRTFAVLIEPLLAESWPQFSELLELASKNFNVKFIKVPVVGSAQQVISAIPDEAQAAIVGVLSQYSDADVERLAKGLIKRKLPSYTFGGERGVKAGFLVTVNQMSQAHLQISRRVAIDIQRILLGANAEELPVNMQFASRVIYNQGTGLSIGFAPKWDDIMDARVINQEQFVRRRAFSIQEAVIYATKNNIDLQAAAIDVDIANKDVQLARVQLLPRLSLGANFTQINEERVVAGQNPEQRVDAALNFTQSLYAESVWADHSIKKHLSKNQGAQYQAKMLDTAQQAASAYLNLLSAKSDEEIRKANLEVTRKNLELAENRLRVGASVRSDVLRWKSQMAIDRKNMFASEARRRNAELELARLMNLPRDLLVDAREPNTTTLLEMLTDERFEKFVANEIQWQAFQAFYKEEALKNSPELKSFDSLLDVNERERVANRRGYYLPDFSLEGQAGHNIDQAGLGAVDDVEKDSWTVSVRASLPLDFNGQRRKTSSKKKLEQRQLLLQRQAAAQRIVTSTGQALFNVGSSYPSIELSHTSANAASESLDLVRNAYAKGRVSITELLDAQNNALSARLLAANSEYTFLQDYIVLMRAAGDFKPLYEGKYSDQWFERLIDFLNKKGINM